MIIVPVRDESSTASATSRVRSPSSMVTTSWRSPSTASRNASCSTRSGSRLAKAYRVTSPSETPRKAETASHSVGMTPLA